MAASTGRPLHALLLPPGPRLLRALRLALADGPAVMPLDPRLPRARLREVLGALRPHAVVDVAGDVCPLGDAAPCPEETAVVVATSGTTGAPKAVELSADAMRTSARGSIKFLDAEAADRWLCCLPTWHVAGLQILLRALEAGGEPIIHDRFRPKSVSECDYEFAALAPTMLHRLLDAGAEFAGVKALLLGGSRLPDALRRRASDVRARRVTTYGATETSGGCVYDGRPLPDVEISVDGDDRIWIRGPMLARGYRLRPDLTDRSFSNGWFRTDDAGRLAADGRLEVVGRLDNVVNCGARKIFPEYVESLLVSHPKIAQAAVLGEPDAEWGEVPVAYLVPDDPADPPAADEVRAHVAERAERWHAPHSIVFAERLPLTAVGKLDRRVLRAAHDGRRAGRGKPS
ncbi:MAG: class I adenylate-forming enzyme family protein [Stackebrandtia sp.]